MLLKFPILVRKLITTLSLKLSIDSFTSEKVDELEKGIALKKEEYDTLNSMDNKDLWRKELNDFEERYKEWKK